MCTAYSASKGAVAALSRSLAVHCRNQGYNIRISTINPDFVKAEPLCFTAMIFSPGKGGVIGNPCPGGR